MKNLITYILVFFMAFMFVTSGIVYLNQKYVNIFKFDFREAEAKRVSELRKLSANDFMKIREAVYTQIKSELDESKKDDTKVSIDSTYLTTMNENVSKIDKLSEEFNKIAQLRKDNSQKDKKIKELESQSKIRQDSIYNEWVKATVKLYESMDSKDAAKFIQKYSDNVARDLIYTMKKKKAAAILSNLNPDMVINLTKAQ
ncbi:MAG: hypothetical protein K9J16_02305 [Melioribacteraceae bacterium]|nr:hypothetical protein [Melioribacteraceae bacterium]MCF8353730.1 hypothetical protein [Melioribacteraceae bacterium]MCF8392461.1 hypothetical protein [Melioribacteraceae bacterium]MCF8418372.1 hypothetical protein [Melioribacteraceae bacterium]